MAIRLNKIIETNYSLVFEGNDGENEAILTYSSGQSGHRAIRFTTIEVDNGEAPTSVLRTTTIRHGADIRMHDYAVELLTNWLTRGLPSESAKELYLDTQRVSKALKRFFRFALETKHIPDRNPFNMPRETLGEWIERNLSAEALAYLGFVNKVNVSGDCNDYQLATLTALLCKVSTDELPIVRFLAAKATLEDQSKREYNPEAEEYNRIG